MPIARVRRRNAFTAFAPAVWRDLSAPFRYTVKVLDGAGGQKRIVAWLLASLPNTDAVDLMRGSWCRAVSETSTDHASRMPNVSARVWLRPSFVGKLTTLRRFCILLVERQFFPEIDSELIESGSQHFPATIV